MKKLISILLAISMIMGLAMAVGATEVADVDAYGWWVAHTEGLELKADAVLTVTFTNTTYETAACNWNAPLWILYSGTEAKVNGAGYMEYWVQRADNYGWGNQYYYNFTPTYLYTDDLGNDIYDGLTTVYPDYLTERNIKHEASFADGFLWENLVATLKSGCECTLTAKLEGTNAVVTMTCAGITTTMTLPVDTNNTTYVSLTGELTKLTDIEYTYAPISTDEGTGDAGTGDTGTGDTGTGDAGTGDIGTGDVGTGSNDTTDNTATTPADKTYTLPDLDCTGWWTAKSEGIELTTDGVIVTFHSSTYETASSNWNGPLWILYTADEPVVNGANYLEYWVHRLDNYGWGNNEYYKVTLAADTYLNTAFPDNIAAAGIKHEATFAEGFLWENLVADLKAGIDVTVTAQLVGSNAVITMTGAGITNTMTVPVDTSKPVYLSLSGELNTLTNISVSPATGDATNLIALGAAMVLAATGVVAITVSKKKFF